ncbi:MAG TPA: Hpt domain-containing protein, partial [Ramlibacter sp.]|nr:Hpt domain-containing protein [Ramlibacter sp.]
FLEGQRDFVRRFGQAQADAHDPAAARRAAHTLRGVAGNIGARAVQAAAGALEDACAEHAPAQRIQALLAELAATLQPVIAGIESAIGGVPAASSGATSAPPAVIDEPALARRVSRLASLLADSDSEAIEAAIELAQSVRGSALERPMGEVLQAAEQFDFESAAMRLNALRAEPALRG